ncbi:MAG: type IX secretion system membrane protein PorP/SprF [Bacteroidetes bacterium]|nr:type IX secretion system membrane protein PorP/SprF [Bacteroidota bacterium]
MYFLLHTNSHAQHYPQYSRYLFNGLAINPAYAGSDEAFTVAALYRNQWTGFDGHPVTQTFSAHAPLKKMSMAAGLLLCNDKTGVTGTSTVVFSYAYRVKAGRGKLSLGLDGGVHIIRSQWSQLATVEAGDAAFAEDSRTGIVPDAGFGVYYYDDMYFAGISVPGALSYKEEMAGNRFRTYHDFANYNLLVHGGALFTVHENIKIKPSLLLRYHPNSPPQLDINLIGIWKDAFVAGFSYRTGDAVTGLLEYRVNDRLRIGYAFDYTLTELDRYNNGSHEIMIRYTFLYQVNASNPRYF